MIGKGGPQDRQPAGVVQREVLTQHVPSHQERFLAVARQGHSLGLGAHPEIGAQVEAHERDDQDHPNRMGRCHLGKEHHREQPERPEHQRAHTNLCREAPVPESNVRRRRRDWSGFIWYNQHIMNQCVHPVSHLPAFHADGTITAIVATPAQELAGAYLLTLALPPLPVRELVGGRYMLARCGAQSLAERAENWQIYLRRPLLAAGRRLVYSPDGDQDLWRFLAAWDLRILASAGWRRCRPVRR